MCDFSVAKTAVAVAAKATDVACARVEKNAAGDAAPGLRPRHRWPDDRRGAS